MARYEGQGNTTGVLTSLLATLRLNMAYGGYIGAIEARAAQIARYRRYYDGEHDAAITDKMRKMLRLSEIATAFNQNYAHIVVDTPTNRLAFTAFETAQEDDPAQAWLADIYKTQRLQLLQRAVHRAALRDGETFIMVSHDASTRRVRLTHELSFDGLSGVIPFYASDTDEKPIAAAKVWHELIETQAPGEGLRLVDQVRVNVYYPDRIERFISAAGGITALTPYTEAGESGSVAAWADRGGAGLGIPLIHFRNRPVGSWGLSELNDYMPLQDAINRVFHSLIMAGEKTGFVNRVAIFNPDPDGSGINPGDWLLAPANRPEAVNVTTLPPGDVSGLLSVLHDLRTQIAVVTTTPAAELMGRDGQSGESLKMLEGGLIGKIEDAQAEFGAAWEAVARMAHRIAAVVGNPAPPALNDFSVVWKPAALRDDRMIVSNAVMLAEKGVISAAAARRAVAGVYGWGSEDLDRIGRELVDEQRLRANAAAGVLPDFTNADLESIFAPGGEPAPELAV